MIPNPKGWGFRKAFGNTTIPKIIWISSMHLVSSVLTFIYRDDYYYFDYRLHLYGTSIVKILKRLYFTFTFLPFVIFLCFCSGLLAVWSGEEDSTSWKFWRDL